MKQLLYFNNIQGNAQYPCPLSENFKKKIIIQKRDKLFSRLIAISYLSVVIAINSGKIT